MFENYDFDYLIENMLSNVPDTLDKREGSVIYDALAPIAVELANFYVTLDIVMNEVFADSASYYYLIKRAAERGLYPREETKAYLKMVVTPSYTQINAGDRFNLDTLNYEVVEAIDAESGYYKVVCETAGIIGNQQLGTLLPIEYIDGLESAELTEVLIPGEDEEDVETFRARYFASFSDTAFGGNKSDYKKTVNAVDGVGGCKVIRMWNGNISPSDLTPSASVDEWYSGQSASTLGANVFNWIENVYNASKQSLLTVGGKVKVIINDSEYNVPSEELVRTVKQLLDPEEATGEGEGLVPIGHVVEVVGVQETSINISFTISYQSGYNYASIRNKVEEIIDTYFDSLKQEWANSDNLIITSAALITLITNLNLPQIVNISNATISKDGMTFADTVTLDSDCIPIRGEISG